MAQARKTIFSLGGPTYMEDPRAQEAQAFAELQQRASAQQAQQQLAQQQLALEQDRMRQAQDQFLLGQQFTGSENALDRQSRQQLQADQLAAAERAARGAQEFQQAERLGTQDYATQADTRKRAWAVEDLMGEREFQTGREQKLRDWTVADRAEDRGIRQRERAEDRGYVVSDRAADFEERKTVRGEERNERAAARLDENAFRAAQLNLQSAGVVLQKQGLDQEQARFGKELLAKGISEIRENPNFLAMQKAIADKNPDAFNAAVNAVLSDANMYEQVDPVLGRMMRASAEAGSRLFDGKEQDGGFPWGWVIGIGATLLLTPVGGALLRGGLAGGAWLLARSPLAAAARGIAGRLAPRVGAVEQLPQLMGPVGGQTVGALGGQVAGQTEVEALRLLEQLRAGSGALGGARGVTSLRGW